MLKLPKKLPQLAEPSFILATPEWLQLSAVLLFLLVAPLLGLFWLLAAMLAGAAAAAHYAAAGILVLLLGGGLYPRNWRRWVAFAADRQGIYLPSFDGNFHHVPWRHVGASTVDVAGIGSNRQRTVILPLKVDDVTWSALLGGRKRRVNAPADAQGFRPFGIGRAGRDVDDTRRRIEQLRAASSGAR